MLCGTGGTAGLNMQLAVCNRDAAELDKAWRNKEGNERDRNGESESLQHGGCED